MDYIKSIEQDLAIFQRKALLTEEYKKILEDWRVKAFNKTSDFFGGPTFEMDKVLSINNTDKVANYEKKSIETTKITCPQNRKIEIVLKHQSTLDLPIPDVLIKLFESGWSKTLHDEKKTDTEGRAVFTDLTVNKSYFAEAIDDNLAANNKALFRAYDDLMVEMYESLNATWQKYKEEWQKEIDITELLTKFLNGLFDGFFSIWDDVMLAYNVITNPKKYADEIYAGAAELYHIIGNLPKIDVKSALEQSKDFTLRLAALFSDECAIYLIANSVLLNIKMYPWGNILPELVAMGGNILGETLRGLIFGALLSLVAGPLGVAYTAFRLSKVAVKATALIKKLWAILQTLLNSTLKLVKKFFGKTAELNHKNKNTALLKTKKENHLAGEQRTHLEVEKKNQSSSGTNPDNKPSPATEVCSTTGCPISMVTGEELLLLDDATLLGIYPFTFQRQYRTTAVEISSVFGYGWSHSLQHHFRFNDSDHTISWTDHENLTTTLPMPDTDIALSANLMAKAAVWLSRQEGEYLFTSGSLNGWVMHVNRLADNSGQVTGFSQQKQRLHLHYDKDNGLPLSLENPAGASLLFRYISTPHGERLAAILLQRHIAVAGAEPELLMRYTYDECGQLSEAINPADEAERYEYRPDYVFSKRRFAGGAEFYWEWQGEGKSVRALRHWSNLPNTEIRYEWNDAAGTSQATYADGSKEIWVHDKTSARQVKHISPSGATVEKHYGQDGELLAEIDPSGNKTEYHYDNDQNCTLIVYPDEQRLRQRFNRGLLMERILYSADLSEKCREKWEYDIDGQLSCYINPEEEEIHYRYTDSGILSEISYGDNTRERYTINALGLLLEYQSRSGETTYYRYNATGKLVFESHTNPQQHQAPESVPATRLVWDNAGRLAAVRWPDGSSRKLYYNAYGGVIKEVDEKQRETHYDYHDNSALIKQVRYPDNSTTQYFYDNIHGEISDIINHNGDRYHIDYTPGGKVKAETLFDGRYIVWDYDAGELLIRRTEYGITRREETALVTQFERDNRGRLTARILPDGQRISYRYDGFGRLCEVDDGIWPLVWQYDKCGRVTQEHQGFSSQYFDYDKAGRLFRMRMPDGNILTHYYHGEEVSQIDLNGQTLSMHQRQRGQEITRTLGQYGELSCRNQFDERGRLLHQKMQVQNDRIKPIERSYRYNVAGELTQITDSYKGIKTFTHDLKSRLTGASHKPYTDRILPDEVNYQGYHEQFRFDGADNLLGCEMPLEGLKSNKPNKPNKSSGNIQDNAITSPEQIKANRLQLYGDRHYQYDEYGNVIRELRGKRQHTEHLFKWDGQHRLIEFRKIRHYRDERDRDFHETVESVYRYAYDAFGRRISKTDNQTGDKTLFFWQGDRLITECHAGDANFHPSVVRNEHDKAENYRCRSYIYAPDGHGFSPLAQLNGRGRGGQIYYYFNDQLGTPQELVTVNGDIVWSAVYKSYGNLAVEYQSVPQPIRLPGQYFDEESGLHYNRYRYYDPYSARYFSQDPIGLDGGENAYSYVPDPLKWIDPLGLNGCPGTEAGKVTDNVTKEAQAAERLGIDLNNIEINNGVASTKIKITSEINYSDVKLLVDRAKAKGARRVEVNTGYIANEKLMDFLEKRVIDGKPFMGGKVIRGNIKTTDFTIIYE